jgi:hypothetical protein
MKTESYLLLIILLVFTRCNQPSTKGETADSTQHSTDTVFSKTLDSVETAVKQEPVFVISDSAVNALNALVDSQFNALYQAVADSSNHYYKVEMEDYNDDYEGQDSRLKATWYFDKNFSIVYAECGYQNGAMEKPSVIEYAVKDNQITSVKETGDFNSSGDNSFIRWDAQNGRGKLKWCMINYVSDWRI